MGMTKEELKALFEYDGDSPALAPIEIHIDALAKEDEPPGLAIGVCILRIDECAPAFIAMLEKARAGEFVDDEDWRLFFRGLYILGGSRHEAAFGPLLQMLQLPPEKVDSLLGDVITEDLSKIVAGAFDGDSEALFDLIADPSLDEFVRNALFGAATFLTWADRIDRSRMKAFIEDFHDGERAPDWDHAWVGWLQAIAMLGMDEYVPRVRTAWEEDRIDPQSLSYRHFEEDLADAKRRPSEEARFTKAGLGYIEDVLDALAWTDPRDGKDALWEYEPDDPGWAAIDKTNEPALNPWRHVGRNDPCPCGSGKKAKKCCMASGAGLASAQADLE